MKRFLVAMLVALIAGYATAQTVQLGDVACSITIPPDGGVASTGDTCTCPTDGGACTSSTIVCGCNWARGVNVDMQCSADVYANKDGGAASSADWLVTFTSPQTDPVTLYLSPRQQHVSVKNVTTATGTVCKFGPSLKLKPR